MQREKITGMLTLKNSGKIEEKSDSGKSKINNER